MDKDVLRCLVLGRDACLHEFHIHGVGVGVQGDDRLLLVVVCGEHHSAQLSSYVENYSVFVLRLVAAFLVTRCKCQHAGCQRKGEE